MVDRHVDGRRCRVHRPARRTPGSRTRDAPRRRRLRCCRRPLLVHHLCHPRRRSGRDARRLRPVRSNARGEPGRRRRSRLLGPRSGDAVPPGQPGDPAWQPRPCRLAPSPVARYELRTRSTVGPRHRHARVGQHRSTSRRTRRSPAMRRRSNAAATLAAHPAHAHLAAGRSWLQRRSRRRRRVGPDLTARRPEGGPRARSDPGHRQRRRGVGGCARAQRRRRDRRLACSEPPMPCVAGQVARCRPPSGSMSTGPNAVLAGPSATPPSPRPSVPVRRSLTRSSPESVSGPSARSQRRRSSFSLPIETKREQGVSCQGCCTDGVDLRPATHGECCSPGSSS